MDRTNESLARRFDFGTLPTEWTMYRGFRRGLRLATPSGELRGPDKYRVLEHRRRQAQIRARRALGM